MKIVDLFDRNFEKSIVTVILVATSLILVVQVFMRYVLGSPLVWAEELARYLLVWCTMIGTSLAVRESRHIVVDFAPVVFGARSVGLFSVLSHIGVLIFCGVILYYAIPFVERVRALGQLSPTLEIPMWLVYAALPVGAAASALRTLQAMWLLHRGVPVPAGQNAEESL
ncbi:TRAP transporter small permease [Consotaella salsifontis]|uniref:TRAP transporter small permease protein n=1 Tax=Consotaella salsifontis TaxID=1365950 RepID=A0A1T4SNY5_9HYPH|nr:TRAP transporter small permease [Consotaella salsifontis]SKA29892.1 C4-dicarboxylate transporter, DctQ subunit [Consotaella salsifontis]